MSQALGNIQSINGDSSEPMEIDVDLAEVVGDEGELDFHDTNNPTTNSSDNSPDRKEGDRCQLMDLPLEVLDEIFCVRPELDVSWSCGMCGRDTDGQLRDYVALAGTCKFFRHQMTDDFWLVGAILIRLCSFADDR